jgi:hypothetical protein
MVTISLRMTTRKAKRKKFDQLFNCLRHPLSSFHHLIDVRSAIAFLGLVCVAGVALAFGPAARAQTAHGSHAHDLLIFTTVFTDQGFALPGARVRVRREGEKKFRWEGASDHQGELAFRVPPGTDYEMTIEARGFKTQTRKIEAKSDNRIDLTIRMELPADKGEKP